MSETKNVVASALARLRNNPKSTGAPFQQVVHDEPRQYSTYRRYAVVSL